MSTVSKDILQERQPFDVAWRTIDGLKIRYATDGKGDEKIVLFSPWPESIFAFAPVWSGLTKQFEVFAFDLPGFGRSEARDDLFAPQTMGAFIAKALDAFGLTSVHAVGLDIGAPSVLFAAVARPACTPGCARGRSVRLGRRDTARSSNIRNPSRDTRRHSCPPTPSRPCFEGQRCVL